MIRLQHREDCCGCTACAAACPHGAIRMEADGMGFPYPHIDPDRCIDCGLCEQVCAFKPLEKTASPKAEAIRFPACLEKSQSGGLAYALMHKAIGAGYRVYGAALDPDFVIRHRRVDTLEGLEPLRLSKYAQSDMDGIAEQILADLTAGQRVLFTGTPCQCAGIGSLCKDHRGQLLLADIVCRAVPSPAFWKSFLEANGKGGHLKHVVFRDPALGWHNTQTRLEYNDHVEHRSDFYFFFRENLINRPSCAACPFSEVHPSDITMGDCWGVEKLLPGFADDDRGCSILLANTPAGEAFTRDFPMENQRTDVDADSVRAYSGKKANPLADLVEKKYLCKGYAFVNARFGSNSLREKIKRLIK